MDEEYWHRPHIQPAKSKAREDAYGDRVSYYLQRELELLNTVVMDLGFEYKLELSRGLRKLRRKIRYG